LFTNLALISILTRIMNPPVAGIALSASLSQIVTMGLHFYFLNKRNVNLAGKDILGTILKVLAVSLLMGLAIFALGGIYKDAIGFVPKFIRLVVIGVLGMTTFVILSRIFGIAELKKTEELFLSKFKDR